MKLDAKVRAAKESASCLAMASSQQKNRTLKDYAVLLDERRVEILRANRADVTKARQSRLRESIIKRLEIDDTKLDSVVNMIRGVAKLEDPVGRTLAAIELDNGLNLFKVSFPIGLLGVIF